MVAVNDQSENGHGARSVAGSSERRGTNGRGAVEAAREEFQSACDIALKLVAQDPRDAEIRRDLAKGYLGLDKVNSRIGQDQSHGKWVSESIELCRRLVEENPGDFEAQNRLADSYYSRGKWQAAHGSNDRTAVRDSLLKARDSLQKAREIHEKLILSEPQKVNQHKCSLACDVSRLGDVERRLGDSAAARKQYQDARNIYLAISINDPTKILFKHNIAVTDCDLARVDLELGDLSAARTAAKNALELSQKLARDDPKNNFLLDSVIFSFRRWGEVNVRSGEVTAARDAYEKALELCVRRARDDPTQMLKWDVGSAAAELGDVDLSSSNLLAARDDYQRSAEAFEKMKHDNPNMGEVTDDSLHVHSIDESIVTAYRNLGDVDLRLDNVSAARDAFQNALKWSRSGEKDELCDAAASNGYEEVGDVCMQLEHNQAALDAYRKAFAISQEAAKDHPGNPKAQRDLAIVYEKIGDLYRHVHNDDTARADYQKALAISRKVLEVDPRNAQSRRDMALLRQRLAEMSQESGSFSAARADFQEGLEVFLKLAHENPSSVAAQMDLAHCYGDLGYLEQSAEDFPAAIHWFEQGIAILEQRRSEEPSAARDAHERWLANQQLALDDCTRSKNAAESLEYILAKQPEQIPDLLAIRGRALARNEKRLDAAVTAERLAKLEPIVAENLFHAAEAYALCLAAPATAKSPRPKTEAKPLEDHDGARAMELLNQAKAIGYFKDPAQRAALANDRNLDSLRVRDDFQKLLADGDPNTQPPATNKSGK
jgi:tetratricopeptide (TPR) repeat protein